MRWSPGRQGGVLRRRESDADAGVFWHAGSVLAFPESGLPLAVLPTPGARGVLGWSWRAHRFARAPRCGRRSRVLHGGRRGGSPWRGRTSTGTGNGSGGGPEAGDGIWLRLGEWDAQGWSAPRAQSVALERATWQHDIGVTERARGLHRVADSTARGMAWRAGVERRERWCRRGRTSPRTGGRRCPSDGCPVPKGGSAWSHGMLGRCHGAMVPRGSVSGHPCARCMGRSRQAPSGAAVVVGRPARPTLRSSSAATRCQNRASRSIWRRRWWVRLGSAGLSIGGGLAVLERWQLVGDRLERTQLDDRRVEYPRMDPTLRKDVPPSASVTWVQLLPIPEWSLPHVLLQGQVWTPNKSHVRV